MVKSTANDCQLGGDTLRESAESFLLPEIGADRAAERAQRRENALKNLKHFAPGQSGNPAGQRKGGAVVGNFLNVFLAVDPITGKPSYTTADLEAVCHHPDYAPAAKIAARRILSAQRSGQRYVKDKRGVLHPAGTDPEPGRDFERIINRLEGLPAATLNVNQNPDRSVEEIRTQLRAMIEANPRLMTLLKDRGEIIEADATEIPGVPGAQGALPAAQESLI